MLSETYQQASAEHAANQEVDAANDFLWRYSRHRLDAESYRDTLLLTSGQLEFGTPGPHPFPHMGTWQFMQHGPFSAVYESKRRSVYVMNQRIQRHPYFSLFDGADAAISTAQRPLTITPIQALFSMNSELTTETASLWAKALLEAHPTDQRRIQAAYRTALGRAATTEEISRAHRYLAEARKLGGAPLSSYLHALLSSNEFLFVE